MKKFIYSILILSFVACISSYSQGKITPNPERFNDYWYTGKAEITSYTLYQARYGEIHSGETVLIFVTEPFSQSKQVKLDRPENQGRDNVSVMKLNMTKNFLTGMYPYSMMMSTFTPVSSDKFPNSLKVTTSSQDWCGHTWMQLNFKEKDYQLKGFSYFESEGDINVTLPNAILEDELWTRIRLSPESLPTGKIKLIPSTFYLRLRHGEVEAKEVNAKLSKIPKSEYADTPHKKYLIEYEERSLSIYFEEAFPHRILGWEEVHLSGFRNSKKLITKAKRINTIKSTYWNKNKNANRTLRKNIGLNVK